MFCRRVHRPPGVRAALLFMPIRCVVCVRVCCVHSVVWGVWYGVWCGVRVCCVHSVVWGVLCA